MLALDHGLGYEEDSSVSLQKEFSRQLAIHFARETDCERLNERGADGTPTAGESSLGSNGFGSAASALLRASDIAPLSLPGQTPLHAPEVTLPGSLRRRGVHVMQTSLIHLNF